MDHSRVPVLEAVPCQFSVQYLRAGRFRLWSGRSAILVDQAMQDASLAYRPVEWDHDARVVVRWMLVEALMGTVLVVVLGVAMSW
jgi:hypothetical protein